MARDGYAWWYVDGLSNDGRHGITLIAFIGSVFSPYYALARRRGRGDPLDHCALNVAVYGQGRKRWALTERGRDSVRRDAYRLAIGPSSLAWDGTTLTIDIDETAAPVPTRIRGVVRLRPAALSTRTFDLDGRGAHRWRPIAACATVEVDLKQPDVRWTGPAYLDMNAGDGALDAAFSHWDWSRATGPEGTHVLYDITRRDGQSLSLSARFDPSGEARDLAPPPQARLPPTLWRVARTTRADPGHRPAVLRTFEDTPFYARSLVRSRVMGSPVAAIHESLSLDRFRSPWVKAMLPFRMPRFAR